MAESGVRLSYQGLFIWGGEGKEADVCTYTFSHVRFLQEKGPVNVYYMRRSPGYYYYYYLKAGVVPQSAHCGAQVAMGPRWP